MYGLIDKSDFETKLKTCKKTEIPPKPKRKDVRIIFIDICFSLIFAIKFIPFVISNIPVKSELAILEGILKKLHKGLKNCSIK